MMTLRTTRTWLLAAGILAASLTCNGNGDITGPEPAALVIVEGNNQNGAINQPLGEPLVVEVTDAAGQPVSGVTVSWSVASGGGSVSPESVQTGSDGRAAAVWILGGVAGDQSVTALVADLQATVFNARALVAGVAHLALSTQPSSSAISGVPFTEQPVIQVQGANGEPLAGIPVTAAADGATLSGTTLVESDAAGTARFTDLALNGAAGSYQLTFTAPDLAAVQSTAIVLGTASNGSGQWTAPFNWPIVAIHMILLPSGKVLSIGRTREPQIWDPGAGNFVTMASPAWLFCAGHALLADGQVLVAGGHIDDGFGLPNTTVFTDGAGWSSSAEMVRGRWYPTVTVMGNGEAVITAGTDQDSMDVTIPEVWSNGTLRQLPGADLQLPWYPRVFLAPDGSLYIAGGARSTFFMSTSGSGSVTPGPRRAVARNYGSAVMYDDGKILYAGGGFDPSSQQTAEIIDLNEAGPVWRATSSLAFARRHLNLTVLPTGEVLATGGVAGADFNDVSKPVHAAEVWNPATGQWTTLASNATTRGYHGTSLLLPDGRILNAGSGEGAGAPDEFNAELFSPPYLSRGARPTITSAPAEVGYGSQFRIETPDAAAIGSVSLIRLGAVTHAFDQNQRFQRLAFTADPAGLTVTAPTSSNRAPPGHYMVFILNGADVPSVAKIVRLR
jgi:hypothetical protein